MQKKRKLFITLGIIIAVIPLLGIPISWKYAASFILGIWVAGGAFLADRSISSVLGFSEKIKVVIQRENVKEEKKEIKKEEEK